MKRTNMAGFLCKSPAATAVCTTMDPRSAIVPRRTQRSSVDHAMLMDMKYSRLVESRRFALAEKRSKAMSAARRECGNPHNTSNVSSLSTSDHVFQGCAGKVKKHLSKMEGVTSFSIDLESKRVTVMGHVSPVGVLESISKVKKAEFWSSK